MKIATFNINNINRRLPNLLRWLRSAKPDAVALQELKSTDADFPCAAIEKAGYGAVWRGQKTWNGVAILARKAEPVLIREGGSIPVVLTLKQTLGVETLLLGWGLNTDNLHSPDEHFTVADFQRGIASSADLWGRLAAL